MMLLNLLGLKSVSIKLFNPSKIDESALNKIILSTKFLHHLKHLHICVEDPNAVSDKTLEAITEAINNKSSTLISLMVSFPNAIHVTNKRIKSFADSLAQLTKLKKLEINLSESRIKDGVAALATSLHKLDRLRDLTLCFSMCSELDHLALGQMISTLIKLDLLEVLYLDISNTNITNLELISLCNVIPELKNLKKLTLDLSNFKISYIYIVSLLYGVSVIKNVKELCLLLDKCELLDYNTLDNNNCDNADEKTITFAIDQAFKSYPDLHNLESLKFGLWEITNLGLLQFAKSFDHLPNLKKIDIDAEQCLNITNHGVINFIKSVITKSGLEAFTLDIRNCPQLTANLIPEINQIISQENILKINIKHNIPFEIE